METKGMNFAGKHALVLGLGESGLAIAHWLARAGARLRVADTRPLPERLAGLRECMPTAEFIAGEFTPALLEGIDLVLLSPGLSPDKELAAVLHPVVLKAQQAGVEIIGDIELFCRERASLAPDAPLVAITGTNGKTTVTSLTGHLCRAAGLTVKVAGNISPAALDVLRDCLDTDSLPQCWVLELSSFQLDGVTHFEPSAATVLNLTQDHLDWHGDMAAYGAAKARIFGQQGLLVLNREDPAVMAMLPEPVRVKLQKPVVRAHVTFGSDMPKRPGDYGIETVNGMTWLVRAMQADETRKRRKDEEEELHIQRLMPADALRIRGRHNAVNALAALALASSAGCPLAPMLFGLREYRGEPHRVEPVAIIHEVEYFDDSKGTNVGATVAALLGLGAERRIVVILGGDGKGQDFSPLLEPVTQHVRAAVLIGRDAPGIRDSLQSCGVTLQDAADLQAAVQACAQLAQAGDAVLLSPACASLDMFRNYEHRAEVFRDAVAELADAAGVSMEGAL